MLANILFSQANLDSSVPLSLRTGLDGPKWVPPSGARRSQSRPAQQSCPTDAPTKPRSGHREVQDAHLRSSVRRLFSSSTPSQSSSVSSDDSSVSDDSSAVTPRPPRRSRSSSVPVLRSPAVGSHHTPAVGGVDIPAVERQSSFLEHFVPRVPPPAFFHDLRSLGHTAAGIASGIAGGVVQAVSASHQSVSPSPSSAASPSQSLPHLSSRPPSPSPLPPAVGVPAVMPTVLPLPKDINVKDVRDFDRSPADLSMFDTQIENALDRWDIPAYSGGCVTGDVSQGFEFVISSTVGCAPNYRLGGKLCSGLCNKLTGAAAQWWDDYAKSGKPRPNCWKKATDPSFIPAGLVEVSLYDLLAAQFDPTIDAQHAELELDSYRWDPLDKKALGLVPFRGHVSRLCTRAGKAGWALRGKLFATPSRIG